MATRVLSETHPITKVVAKLEEILLKERLQLFWDVGRSTFAIENIDTGAYYYFEDTEAGESVTALPRTLESENICATDKGSSGSASRTLHY